MHARRTAAAAVGLLALGALTLPASPAAASCTSDDVAQLAGRADVAFVGTVTEVRGDLARLSVSDVYAGSPGTLVVVDGRDPESPISWTDGRQYLVLAQDTGDDLTTTLCDGTRPVDDQVLAAAESALGPATPLGRGTGAADPDASAAPDTTPAPTAPSPTAPADVTATAASEQDDTSTSRLALGIVLGVLLVGSFFLPQLRRHNRDRRRGSDET